MKKNNKLYICVLFFVIIVVCIYLLINFKDIRFKYFINEKNAKKLIEERLSEKYDENIKIIDINISKEYYNYFDADDETLVFDGTAYNVKYKDKIFNYEVTEGEAYVDDDYKVLFFSTEIENTLKADLKLLEKTFIDEYTYNIEYRKDVMNITSLELFKLRDILSINITVTINDKSNFEDYYEVIDNLCKNIFNSIANNVMIEINTKRSVQDFYCSNIYIPNVLDLYDIKKVSKCFDL